MSTPNDRKYLPSHEWHKIDGELTTIGITLFAADELTDVTYVSLPKVGATVKAGERFGEIESVKATSDLMSGVDGTVAEVNARLTDEPGLVNSDPYEAGWMIKVKTAGAAPAGGLLPVDEYLKQTGH